MERVISFEVCRGEEWYLKIEIQNNGKYYCFETSQYGGKYVKLNKEFNSFEEAKEFIDSLK